MGRTCFTDLGDLSWMLEIGSLGVVTPLAVHGSHAHSGRRYGLGKVKSGEENLAVRSRSTRSEWLPKRKPLPEITEKRTA